jgi:hypothetical protein
MMTALTCHLVRGLLALQRHALVRTLCAVETKEQRVEPVSVAASANIHTAIAVIDAVLAEPLTLGTHHERDDTDNDPDRAGPD